MVIVPGIFNTRVPFIQPFQSMNLHTILPEWPRGKLAAYMVLTGYWDETAPCFLIILLFLIHPRLLSLEVLLILTFRFQCIISLRSVKPLPFLSTFKLPYFFYISHLIFYPLSFCLRRFIFCKIMLLFSSFLRVSR